MPSKGEGLRMREDRGEEADEDRDVHGSPNLDDGPTHLDKDMNLPLRGAGSRHWHSTSTSGVSWARLQVRRSGALADAADAEKDLVATEFAINGVALYGCDVAEIYSPGRFTQELLRKRSYGLQTGFFINMTAMRDEGNYWDLGQDEDQQMLKELQEKERPQFLIGSPPCTSFCPLL
eukprot:2523719-Amphidinium_carterae.2